MELSDLIPDRSENWIVKNNYLMYKKYVNIPVCYIGDDDAIYIFLDNKIHNVLFKLVKHLMKMDIDFYFTSPLMSNPRGIDNPNNEIIKHYLYSYSQKEFFHGFKKIGFDLIHNMVKWSEKSNSYDLIKPNFVIILKDVIGSHYDYYTNKNIFNYPEEIREDFQTLYRDIQISKIL